MNMRFWKGTNRISLLARVSCLLLMLLPAACANGMIRLPGIFSNNMVLQQSTAVKIWGWGAPYEKVVVLTSWDKKTYPAVVVDGDGNWAVNIRTPSAGGPYEINIKGQNQIHIDNVLIGEVWLCSGQSNMEMCGNWGMKEIRSILPTAHNDSIRFFYIPKRTAPFPQQQVEGHWVVCDSNSLKSFSAVGYFFGRHLLRSLHVPTGLIEASWGGTSAEVWTPGWVVKHDPLLSVAAKKIAANGQCPHLPGYAFNAMIAPITSYALKGVIWYQGENNTVNPGTYDRLFTHLIDAWRAYWKKELPFYYVQIAPFHYAKVGSGALLREAQLKSSTYDHVGMVVITDLVSDTNNVHPGDKRDVGLRLANWALARSYHKTGIAYASPEFDHIYVRNHHAYITFRSAKEGLMLKGDSVEGLYLAGRDRRFYPAKAKIEGDTLVVWSSRVPDPVAVRYGFADAAMGNLFGRNGLPVGPFRTDDWSF
jgi:sialate O-acetylesterase